MFASGFSSVNSHNPLNSVSDKQTTFLNQRETLSENHFHFHFIIYIWSWEIPKDSIGWTEDFLIWQWPSKKSYCPSDTIFRLRVYFYRECFFYFLMKTSKLLKNTSITKIIGLQLRWILLRDLKYACFYNYVERCLEYPANVRACLCLL